MPVLADPATEARSILAGLGLSLPASGLEARTPVDGALIGHVTPATPAEAEAAIARAAAAFRLWRSVPGPKRGELVRLYGEELRREKDPLGRLVTLEAGKTLSEGLGEVQEMIDICDFAAGLSRQLYGLTMTTERPGHRLMETWHPLGPVGVISAFNFPVAVWCWNLSLALVCGDPVLWKPSEKTPLTALAVHAVFERALARFAAEQGEFAVPDISQLLIGGPEIGNLLVEDRRVALVSATGSTRMGRIVAPKLAARFARSLLELGGNNALIVTPSADLDLALKAIAFAAMGTAGQRCTSLRRLLVHESLKDEVVARLKPIWASASVGDPRDPGTLVGPLIDAAAGEGMANALEAARAAGGIVHGGEAVDSAGIYRRPALVEMPAHGGPMLYETFAPVLYVVGYSTLEEAIELNNSVGAGLSSAIFTTDLRESERFVSAAGSDCGIVNVNIGTSGAEIGGAFGGEKETGGGREAGSDSWRAYMRRATNTINYSNEIPLAQGVRFDIGAG
ncbi:aldehyde dehydrogenase family protein [Sandaracinobacter neustonicus]|uniref:aldehyde dehydrogenase (NAD(+)) n=1 Tax=Sandaracinobacter neustonicus TaxID=1715348 RepID=A0A501XGM6_9SPHN|nr:aldehyde dehydrogenase family protein [Sandaracinobacter neustonicus]TPE59559.1 aldehyde dehydrogenase family protein [Sandaracinobacter neustonicus]